MSGGKLEPQERARTVAEEWADRDRYVRQTAHGVVELERLTVHEDPDTGATHIEVYAAGADDPHFRIFNPPVLVPDPAGSIRGAGGRRYRVDPLAALAETVAEHGGAQSMKPRRGV